MEGGANVLDKRASNQCVAHQLLLRLAVPVCLTAVLVGYRPTDKRIAELADEWAFAAENMGVKRAR